MKVLSRIFLLRTANTLLKHSHLYKLIISRAMFFLLVVIMDYLLRCLSLVNLKLISLGFTTNTNLANFSKINFLMPIGQNSQIIYKKQSSYRILSAVRQHQGLLCSISGKNFNSRCRWRWGTRINWCKIIGCFDLSVQIDA